ncbi:Ribonucleoside-diphosphate reductase small chain A [Abeliophyllum distichum]|uniref:Ribonucleoside-diphosphate reductase small chain A n=1 Tax=Abeliophyllum distichum TaxID=126358 RepID=A0ABD1RFX7_9LAMI
MGSSEMSIETICFDVLGIIKALGFYKKCDLALKVFEWVRNRPDSDKLVNGSAVAVIINMWGKKDWWPIATDFRRRMFGRQPRVAGDIWCFMEVEVEVESSPSRIEREAIHGNEGIQEVEPILMEQSQRFCMFPIRYPQLWEMYKKAEASFWTAEEVDLSQDVQQWEALSKSEKHFISHVLAFFAASDGIVLENLAARFLNDVQIPEARAFYGFQMAMENIHSEMYSLLLETYIKDSEEKNRLFNAIEDIPCIAQKAKWALHWIKSSSSFAERLVAFACVEGIFFSGRYSSVSIQSSWRMISTLRNQLHSQNVHLIVHEAVEIETQFVCDALPCALIGMNSELMSQYIKFVADHLLVALGYERKYNVENPFDWMEFISLQGKSNFFERRVGDYQKASVMTSLRGDSKNYEFKMDDDF